MNTSNTTTASKQVVNIVFCDTDSNILSFVKFSTAILADNMMPENHINEPFAFAIVQYADRTGFTYTPNNTQYAAVA